MMQHMMGQSRMMQNCLGIQQIPRPSAAQVRARRSAASHNSRPFKCGWFNGVQMTELLIVSVLITLSICTQTSLAEARPGHKKPPFNGSIFGKRSMSSSSSSSSSPSLSSAAPGPLQAALLANNGGQWPLVGSDTSGLELVAAIQQQDSLIRSTINRCLTRQYDFADPETVALCEDIVALRDQFAGTHMSPSAAAAADVAEGGARGLSLFSPRAPGRR